MQYNEQVLNMKIDHNFFLTNLLLTEPDWGASLIYSSIVARKDGGGC